MKKPVLLFFLSLTLVSAGPDCSFAQTAAQAPAAQPADAKSSKETPARQKGKKARAVKGPAVNSAARGSAPKTSGKLSSGYPVLKTRQPAAGQTAVVEPKKVNSLLFATMERLETLLALYDNLQLQVSKDTLNKASELEKASNKATAGYFKVAEPDPGRETLKTYKGLLNSALKSVKALKDVKDRVIPEETEAAIGLCRELSAAIDKELAGTKLVAAAAPGEPARQEGSPPAAKAEPAAGQELLNNETAALAALSELRKAVESYKAAKGKYPGRLNKLTPKYLPEIPAINVADHPTTDEVLEIDSTDYDENLHQVITDSGKWLYFTNKKSKHHGLVLIDCSHKDARGVERYKAGAKN